MGLFRWNSEFTGNYLTKIHESNQYPFSEMKSRARGSKSLTEKQNFDIHRPKQTVEKYCFLVALSKKQSLGGRPDENKIHWYPRHPHPPYLLWFGKRTREHLFEHSRHALWPRRQCGDGDLCGG